MAEDWDAINWFDHDRGPMPGALRLSDDLYATWSLNNDRPTLWHWCTKANWIAKRRAEGKPDPEPETRIDDPQWAAAGSGGHGMPSRDPLTLTPSVYWPDCCGMHGFVTDGIYKSV